MTKRKGGAFLALFAAFAVVVGGAITPILPSAQAEPNNPANVETWGELEAAINSNASEITITKDIVAEGGKTLNVTKAVTIKGNATIYRDPKASTYEPMFTVSGGGNLTLAGDIKLSGKSATCSGETVTPAVTEQTGTETITYWEKHPSNERYWNQETGTSPVEGKRVMLGFAESNRADTDPVPGIAYIGDDNIVRIADEKDVIEQDSNGNWQLKSGVAENKHVFTVTDVDHDQYGAAWFNTADGKVLGRTNELVGDLAPVIVVDKDNPGLNEGAYKIENESNFKFKMGGLDGTVQKYIIPNNKQAAGEADKQSYAVAGARPQVNLGYGWDKTWLWVETETQQEVTYWTVEGTDEHFDTKEKADQWASEHTTTTPGDCTPEQTCSKITTDMFNGSKDNEKGFFVQVNGGTFNLTDKAELRDFITGPNVSYVAPVVAKGGTVNISGGKITHNSVGYTADNSKSGDPANKIGKEKEDGWNEIGYLANWRNTETAGAIILTEKSKGVISGGEISGNRGDTGAIVVQGKPDRDRSAGQDAPVENGNATASSLDIQNGTLDNNVGVHHAGAVYSFNGAGVEMSGGKITNNFAWNKGGAVWASEESYASIVWAPKNGAPSNLPVGEASFIMKGGEISGNMAVHRGGAIEVMSDHVALIGGQINNNYSRVLGGAIYVEGDGVDRMYQLYLKAGCITDNHAVRDENYETSAPLYRTLNTATDCDFSNAMDGATANNVSDRGLGFNKYYGHGGGIWLCPFGGNTTFAVPNSEVTVAGNTADQSSSNNKFNDGDGKDMLVRPQAPGKLNGFNFLDLGPNNVFKDEKTGAIFSNDTAQGTHYAGSALALTNTAAQTCTTDGVMMKGNIASDGGAIASNGTIVFGEESDVYQAITTLKLKKLWSESVPTEPIQLKLYAEVNGEKIELPGYTTTLNGKADTLVEADAENEGALGEDQYNENSSLWETEPWVGEMGLPLSVVTKDGTVPLFTFDDNGKKLDPTNLADLKTIYEKVEAGQLTAANAKVGDWKLVVEETIGGKVKEDFIYLENGKLEELTAHPGDVTEFKDLGGHVVGKFGVYPVEMGFSTTIANDLTPPVTEKYVNQDVHDNIVNFDQEFTYDVMAYVPLDATKVTITDTLIEGLEFADANGKRTTDGRATVQQIAIKSTNDHKPHGTVEAAATDTLTMSNQTIGISGDTLTVTIDKATPLNRIKGKWIQVTFKARIKDNYRSLDALKKLEGWQAITADKNAPVLSDQDHEGMANKATYTVVAPSNNGEASYETNTVTVTPETTKLNVAKSWNVNGSAEWPSEVEKVIFGVYSVKGGVETLVREVELNAQNPTAEVTDLAKLKDTTYVAREIKVGDTDVTYTADKPNSAVVRVSDLLELIANTVKGTVNDVDTYVTTNQAPQVEKYVNNKVHADLENFDEVFEYSVMAYVPEGATKVEITDTLTDDLLFVDLNGKVQGEDGFDATKLITNSSKTGYDLVIEPSNNHQVNGVVAGHSNTSWFVNHPERHVNGPLKRADGVVLSNGGKTITVTVNENELKANGKQVDAHGKWIVLSFRATINPASYAKVQEQLGKTDDSVVSGLSWQKITDNTPVQGGAAEHAGLDNTAKYKVYVGNEGTSDYETNTVTVKPKTVKVTAEKTWLDENGQPAEWPADVESVTVNVLGAEGAVVDTLTLTKAAPKATSKELPKLAAVEYAVEEVTIPGYIQVEGSPTGTGTEEDPYVFTNKSAGENQIEKYVNQDVHANLVEFDKKFTYDIMAFVPNDADEIVIKDTLVNALEFVSAAADVKVAAKAENDHTVKSSVAAEGTNLGDAAVAAINGQTLTVTVADAKAYRGQWIQVTFEAKYTQEMIDAAKVGDSKKIGNNGAVLGGKVPHTGTVNTASYDIRVGNDWTKDVKSNTVTVEAKKVQLKATKVWQDPNGQELDVWPEGARVTFALMKNGEQIETKTLSESGEVTFTAQPRLTDVTYTVVEKSVTGVDALKVGKGSATGNLWTFTNKLQPDTPRIEKYINKDVHQDVVLDEVFTYDIIAYATKDATKLTIRDELVKTLVFADGADKVVVEDIGTVNNHKTNGTYTGANADATVSAEGTPVEATVTINGKALEVVIEGDAAQAVRGHYVRVTFRAKLPADAEYVTITDNGSVLSDKEHTGVDNTARYIVEGENGYVYDELTSNTVTVKPKHEVVFSKVEFGIQTVELEGAKIKLTDSEGNVVEEWTSGKEPHKLYLAEGEYTFEEVNAPEGFDAITTTVTFTVDKDGKVTLKEAYEEIGGRVTVRDSNHLILEDIPTKAEIEKYVNKDVHQDLVEFDREFTYDIMAYVSNEAVSAEVYDTLVDNLEFADADGKATTDAAASVSAVVVKAENDHKAGGSVAAEGTPIAADCAIDGQKLTVKVADVAAARGKWIQVTFNARIKDEFRTMDALAQETITDNGSVISDIAQHTGVANTASYVLFDNAGNALESFKDAEGNVVPMESNTVTVVPETVQVEVAKTWLNAADWVQEVPVNWPAGVTVTAKVVCGGEVVAEVTLSAEQPKATVAGLPKLKAGAYTVEEVAVEGVYALAEEPAVTVDEAGNVSVALKNRLAPRKSEMFVDFVKVDPAGKALAGAVLEVTGTTAFDGAAFGPIQWTTDGAPYRIDTLVAGTYTLTEKSAPEGYAVAAPIEFMIDDSGNVLVGGEPLLPDANGVVAVTMVDELVKETPGPGPSQSVTPTAPASKTPAGASVKTTKKLSKTGAEAGWAIVAMLTLFGAGSGLMLARRRER